MFVVCGTVSPENLSQRAIEDYAVVYFGSSLFKILRLLIIAIFSIHLFACIFYRVKEISAYSPDDVTDFYNSRLTNDDVGFSSVYHPFSFRAILFKWTDIWLLQSISYKYVSSCSSRMPASVDNSQKQLVFCQQR